MKYQVFLYISCYIMDIWIAFLTVYKVHWNFQVLQSCQFENEENVWPLGYLIIIRANVWKMFNVNFKVGISWYSSMFVLKLPSNCVLYTLHCTVYVGYVNHELIFVHVHCARHIPVCPRLLRIPPRTWEAQS